MLIISLYLGSNLHPSTKKSLLSLLSVSLNSFIERMYC